MRKIYFCVIYLLLLFLIYGCDASTFTVITVKNESSCNLRIQFSNGGIVEDGYKVIDLEKNESTAFGLSGFGPSTPRDPNYEISIISLLNLDTNDVVEVNVNKSLFIRTVSEGQKAEYLLLINDAMIIP